MPGPRALLEIAQQHEKKGNLAKAAKAYSEHLSNSPSDSRILLRLAEIRERLGDDAVAADAFHQLGMMHSKDGIETKAAAAFRRALDLMPAHTASVEPLAELLVKSGKKRDAVNTLEIGSRAAAASGNLAAQLKMLERAAELDEGLGSKLAYAKCLADSGQQAEAIALLRQALERLDEQRAPLERLQVLEWLVQITGGDPKVALEAANAAVKLRDHRRALIILRISLEREPDNPDLISFVGAVLGVMGEEERALLVFREAGRIYGRVGRGDQARKCWTTVLRLSPDDAEAHAAIGSVPPSPPAAATANVSVPRTQPSGPPAIGSVPPSLPSAPPTIGSVPPNQPSAPPTIGSVSRTQPSTAPTIGSVARTQPAAAPTIGSAPLSQPAAPPAIRSVPPSKPSAPPAIGSVARTQPAAVPSIGSVPPTQRSTPPNIGPVPPSKPFALPDIGLVPPTPPPAIDLAPSSDPFAPHASGLASSSDPFEPYSGPLAGIEMSEMDDALSALCEHFPASPTGSANLDPETEIDISLDLDTTLSIEPDPGRDTF